MVSKIYVCMTNNYSRGCGFLALLLSWPLALQILSFAIGRVRVDEIEKRNARGAERIACNGTWLRRIIQQGYIETKMDKAILKRKFYYYINLRVCVRKTYLTFTLALKQICKSSIFIPHKE
jgi:hypothetical protein